MFNSPEQFLDSFTRFMRILPVIFLILGLLFIGLAILLSFRKGPKNPFLAGFFSFIYPGLGHIYIREYITGIIYGIIMFLIGSLPVLIQWAGLNLGSLLIGGPFSIGRMILFLFIWIYSIKEAYRSTEQYNNNLVFQAAYQDARETYKAKMDREK